MKSKRLVLVLVSSLLLSGCDLLDSFLNVFNSKGTNDVVDPAIDEDKTDSETIDEDEDENIDYEIPKDKVGEFYGGLVNDGKHVGYEFTASLEAINKPTTGQGEVNIYSFNDFHGAVLESESEPGLKAFASFLKEKSTEDNTLIFDQGDTWQGSLESNYSYGAIVHDVFNYAGVTLRTVGNHDFDWGLDHLIETENRTLDGEYMPCLAANVYDFENSITGTTQQSQIGKEYATFILENGIKVGVVGVVGVLMSSICTNRIETVNFTNPINKIKEMSDYLRNKKKCDVIVASTHNGIGYFYDSLSEISPKTNKKYADIVLGGHEHTQDSNYIDGTIFAQSDSHGKSCAYNSLKYDFDNNCLDGGYDSYSVQRSDFDEYSTNVDPTINKMVDDYLKVVEPIGDEVLSTHFNGYYDTGTLARLMEEAIFERVYSEGFDLDYSLTNSAREGFKGDVFTYRDLYHCFPFDNEIVLMEVDAKASYGYRPSHYGQVDPNKQTHLLAVIDYLALHQNSYREYDRYPDDIVRSRTMFKDENNNTITYRDILRDFLLANPNRDFSASLIN